MWKSDSIDHSYFLNKNLYINSQLANLFPNENCYFFDELYVITKKNIHQTHNFLKVKYFSINQLIKYNFCNTNIQGSIANSVKNFLGNSENNLIINNYFHTNNSIKILANAKESTEKKSVYLISSDQIEYHLSKHYNNFYKCILGAKILSSSFFLSDLINFHLIEGEISINKDIFFKSLIDFKNFAQAAQLNHVLLNFQPVPDFYQALHIIEQTFSFFWSDFQPNFYLNINNIYLPEANVYNVHKNINVDSYYCESLVFKRSEPFDRVVNLNIENNGNQNFFYMNKVLGLSIKSLNTLIIDSIYNCIINNQNSLFLQNNTELLKYIENIKNNIKIIDKVIFIDSYPTFFYFSSYNLEKVKIYLRQKKIFKAIVINCKTLEKTVINVRSGKKRKILKFTY